MKGVVEQHLDGCDMVCFYGISDETKPTDDKIAGGSSFIETDTQKIFILDESDREWHEWSFA